VGRVPSTAPPALASPRRLTALDVSPPGLDNLPGAGLVQLVPLPPPPPPPPAPFTGEDRFESNESEDQPTDLGTLTGSTTVDNLSITIHANGLPDYDWYTLRAGAAGTLTVQTTTVAGGNIELVLFGRSGNTMVQLGANPTPNVGTRTVSIAVAAGQQVWVEVKGRNSSFGVHDTATYTLGVNLA